ncbi:unnamed protein product [Didymodactylos carnosus]|uniref:Uncharacterized protein n=1 Tax=Didymodactylos carnosus TaxID=1234261 RepID=A0A8S2L9V7_9BILA|nr:unnamed protein product [Didymodactylos carnosus]CAF3891370.1 unnamed protein product [Didymodactylos carnosus]
MEYYHLPLVHDDVLLYSNEKFYNLVNELARENVLSILKIQSIHSVQSLLHTNNVVELFNYDCSDLIEIKKKSCFMLSDGTYIIKCGIINGLNYLTNILKLKDEQRTKLNESSSSLNELIIKHPLLKALISYYKTSTISLNKHQEGFLTTLINNITSNLKCRTNNVRYNQTMLNFALSLFILDGKNAYEFTRLNISPAFSSLTTLKKITSNNNENVIEEGKFQIDHLLKHASVIDCRYGFMSEDSTGVIRKIEYDSVTNAFIGFSTPLIAGLPSCKHFQIDAFDELKTWFSTYEKAQLLNVHMFQPITTNSALSSPYLFSTYGTSSKFTPNDIWCRWVFIHDECYSKQANLKLLVFQRIVMESILEQWDLLVVFSPVYPILKLQINQVLFVLLFRTIGPGFIYVKKNYYYFFITVFDQYF